MMVPGWRVAARFSVHSRGVVAGVDPVLDSLNPEQRQAVLAAGGPCLILAGAGSGKTRVLTARIAHLIRTCGVPPYRILAFTFTNKAAREMRGRVESMLGGQASDCWLGTFHSTGVRILRREAERLGWQRNFAIYDTDDSEALLKRLIEGRTLARHLSASEARSTISAWKNDAISLAAAAAAASDTRDKLLAEIYADYDRALRRNNAFDFDDLIARPVQLFTSQPEVLAAWAGRFEHVLVDEFQDTNTLQMTFIEHLAGRHGNLFVVGDDDQSIYGWRGARIENILEFEGRFPGTSVVRLEQNYRSTAPILAAANHVIAQNRGRKGKNLWTAQAGGEPVRVGFHADEEDEALRAAQIVQEIAAAGGKRADVVVLYRTNAQSRALEDAMRRANLPYQIVGGTRFYERREVRDVVAYLKTIHNPADSVSLTRIVNVPRRGIGDTTIDRIRAAAEAQGTTLGAALERAGDIGLGAPAARRAGEFAALLSDLRRLAATATCVDVVQAVLERTGYLDYLRESDPGTFEARRENVEELVSAAQAHAEQTPDDPSLRTFLEEISLFTDLDTLDPATDAVTLMTLHSAKGLEFDTVILTGLEERLLPHASNLDTAAGLEEERRLFYVGMTRARSRLVLLSAASRRRYGAPEPMMQSRFLGELPEAGVEYATPLVHSTRRPAWASRQDSWRSYAEGDPDTFWSRQGLDADRFEARAAAARHEPAQPARGAPLGWAGDEESQEPAVLEVGMRVRHEKFGVGQVQRIEGQGERMKVTVVFGRNDAKKFVARYARLVPMS
jgi:DNA helicase-2/ATP-dependent DNA helicase PcrA